MDDTDRLSELRRELRRTLGVQRYEVWLGAPTELRYQNGALQVACRSTAEMEWLRRRLYQTLESACQAIWGPGVPIVLSVLDHPTGEPEHSCPSEDDCSPSGARRSDQPPAAHEPQLAASCPSGADRTLSGRRRRNRDRWTFETLARGSSNRLALSAVESVLEQPGRFSPLLLYGSCGVGKSHLLQATATELRQSRCRPAVLLLTAEQFTSQFLTALPERTLPSFRQKCRTVDALLLDDVQFLIGKKATLEELLHTIDALHERGAQVLLTADRAPNEFPPAAGALAAKLAGGLAMQLDPPDYSMRLAIVESIARRVRADLEPGVGPLVAQQVIGSARLLSGAINRLVATSMAVGRPITTDLASPALAEFARQNTPQVKLADVQRAVCDVFGVEPASLKSKKKTRSLVEPRMIAMWLARRYTRAALSEIGDYFGRRSHSTVVAAQKKCDRLVGQKAELMVGDAACSIDDAIRKVETALRTA